MIIVKFTTKEAADHKLAEYNGLARVETSPPDFSLTIINKHTTQDIWWFNGSDCIDNGGLGKGLIEADIAIQDTFNADTYQELMDLGYLPDPNDEK